MSKKYEKLIRKHKITLNLNKKELAVLKNFLKKNKHKNQSKFIREIIFNHIHQQLDKNYPNIFQDENENKNQ